MAIADGHGSKACPYSKSGSSIAVNVFCKVMDEFHASYAENLEMLLTYLNREGDTKVAQAVDAEWKRRVLKVHTNQKREVLLTEDGEKNKAEIYKQYGSTLVGLMITPIFVFAFQLGDGDISYVDQNGLDHLLEDEKILGVETHSLSTIDSWKKVVSAVRRRDEADGLPYMLMLSTDAKALVQIVYGRLGKRVYDSAGIACTQDTSRQSGLYFVDLTKGDLKITPNARCLHTRQDGSLTNFKGQNSGVLYIKEATKKGYKEAHEGDSIDLGFAGSNTRRGRVFAGVAHTVDTANTHGIVLRGGRVRRLMPRECFRLQGFSEDQIDKILAISSDAQAYKQAGNSVTVTVIEAIGRRIRAADAELYAQESR